MKKYSLGGRFIDSPSPVTEHQTVRSAMCRLIFLSFMLGMLAGCARGHWDYGSMPREEAMKRAYDCQFMANMQAKGTGGAAPYIADRQFRECMYSRGFVWVQEDNTSVARAVSFDDSSNSVNGKQYGYVVYNEIVQNSKHIKKIFETTPGQEQDKKNAAIKELTIFAKRYCDKYNYEYLVLVNNSPDETNGVILCGSTNSLAGIGPNVLKKGKVTNDLGSFIHGNLAN